MSAKMECKTCNGQGWIPGYEETQECCGGSEWECGASGCTGPERGQEQIQIGCEDCQATGYELQNLKVYNVKDFGAVADAEILGHNATDNTESFQKCVDTIKHDNLKLPKS